MVIEHLDIPGLDKACDYISNIERDGFALFEKVLDDGTVNQLLTVLRNLNSDVAFNQRAGKAFGIRNLLNVLPLTRMLANSAPLRALVEPVFGCEARVVRGIYFDKHRDANRKVAWHQDLTIAVRERVELEGYGVWSVKAGIQHVQPPIAVLEKMVTLRLHLDDTNESNGALRVIPGSHKHGRLDVEEIQSWKEHQWTVPCPVNRGGAMLMRPLLLHSSSAATNSKHRRVLHFEYSSANLPCGMNWYDA
ncbi:MAG: phytanoyl-CoA dioxygenase [Acidobacteria bacterium]|nr:MAG: phytanoyl-CoA dioxygenase [Acidobacteriota bacterium]